MTLIYTLITRLCKVSRLKKLILGALNVGFPTSSLQLIVGSRLVITSEAFESKMQPARHRIIYGLLKEEMSREGGIHALQLRTRTPKEEEAQKAREAQNSDNA